MWYTFIIPKWIVNVIADGPTLTQLMWMCVCSRTYTNPILNGNDTQVLLGELWQHCISLFRTSGATRETLRAYSLTHNAVAWKIAKYNRTTQSSVQTTTLVFVCFVVPWTSIFSTKLVELFTRYKSYFSIQFISINYCIKIFFIMYILYLTYALHRRHLGTSIYIRC